MLQPRRRGENERPGSRVYHLAFAAKRRYGIQRSASPIHRWAKRPLEFDSGWRRFTATFPMTFYPRYFALVLLLMTLAVGCAQRPLWSVQTTPKLEILNQQIKNNATDAQALSNRGYALSLLRRQTEARADLRKAVALKDTGPMHNRVGWAYFNLGDYAESRREMETAARLSNSKVIRAGGPAQFRQPKCAIDDACVKLRPRWRLPRMRGGSTRPGCRAEERVWR